MKHGDHNFSAHYSGGHHGGHGSEHHLGGQFSGGNRGGFGRVLLN